MCKANNISPKRLCTFILFLKKITSKRYSYYFSTRLFYFSLSSSATCLGMESWGKLSQLRHQDFPVPSNLLKLIWHDPKLFPGQQIFLPVCSGSSLRPHTGGTCPEHLSREEVSRRHHLSWLFSMQRRDGSTPRCLVTSLLDLKGDQSPHTDPKGALRHPT